MESAQVSIGPVVCHMNGQILYREVCSATVKNINMLFAGKQASGEYVKGKQATLRQTSQFSICV